MGDLKEASNVAVVGLGYWGPNLLRNALDADAIRVTTICDRDPDVLARHARRNPDLRATTEIDSVLADDRLDAVVLATPISTHYELASRCLDAGKHVLVEKPMTESVADARTLIEMARSRNLVLMPGLTYLYSPPVVAINTFPTDHPSEHAAIKEIADAMGVRSALCTHFAEGGKGAAELATAVAEAADEPSTFRFLYPNDATLREKILTVALRVYGAQAVDYDYKAARQLESYERSGFGKLPVCIAKTHLSISSDPALKGAPTGWVLPVREARASVGAGFIYPLCGDMRTMPGLSADPAATRIDIDTHGQIIGLS